MLWGQRADEGLRQRLALTGARIDRNMDAERRCHLMRANEETVSQAEAPLAKINQVDRDIDLIAVPHWTPEIGFYMH